MKRKIIAVTGARSEFDLLFPVYKELDNDENFDFSLIVTGAHLSERFGYTVGQIRETGLKIADEIYNLFDTDKKIGRIMSLGNQIQSLSIAFNRLKPDIVLIAGDREEALSVTSTCAYMDIPVAHFFGGDIAKDGNIDNSVRYAASKLAHLHFVTMKTHKETLLKLGEEKKRIFVVGNPSLDIFNTIPHISKEKLSDIMNFDVKNDEYLVLIQHPIINESDIQDKQIRITLNAIRKSKLKCFINYPNSDPGNYHIIEAYKEYVSKYPKQFKLFQNLKRDVYINLLRNAKSLIGNSSSGLTEAPSLKLPAINIGLRQKDRTHGENVNFVNNNEQEILDAIAQLNNKNFIDKVNKGINPYGKGNSTKEIVEILRNIELTNELVHKNITY